MNMNMQYIPFPGAPCNLFDGYLQVHCRTEGKLTYCLIFVSYFFIYTLQFGFYTAFVLICLICEFFLLFLPFCCYCYCKLNFGYHLDSTNLSLLVRLSFLLAALP
jgi:hypothetical protein